MDTLTHALSGALLARALTPSQRAAARPLADRARRVFGPHVPVWQALLVGLVAGAFPDSDVVLKFVSDIAYLRGHRGVTHSLVMLPLWALLLGGAAAFAFRRRDAFRRYVWLAAAGVAIHIAGDWITQFGTMLLAPLSDARFGLGSVFIIDLLFSGIIVAGLIGSALLWRSRAPAMLALALLPAYVAITVVGKHEAIAFAQDWARQQGIAAVTIDAAPRPASPFNWSVFVFDGTQYHVAHVNTRRTEPLVATESDNFIRRFSAPYQPLSMATWEPWSKFGAPADASLAREVWQHPQFGFFRWFAMYPLVYRVEHSATETCVWYRDLRFAFPGRDSVPFRYGMCRNGEGSAWSLYALDDIAGRAALR
ncbi:MAG: metal-dependent hydrolase [Burkholderiaceae bacterium]|jgi:inner membrane protein|nr:metal-dependent hydrolase [Burkholderiaceae bacterium]